VKIHRVTGVPAPPLLAEAAACIRAGGTIVFPTDTVYGIGCAPEDEAAIAAVFAAKGRPADKPLAIHFGSPEDAHAFVSGWSDAARAIAEAFWPGPVALVAPRRQGICTAAARGLATISLRCPDDDVCRAILFATGPLAATSANISGAPAFDGASADVSRLPLATLAFIAGPTKLRRESTIVDCSGPVACVLRVGAIDVDALERALSRASLPLVRQEP
jgi:L-threonylcarbamoyladenylate synthase